MKKFICIIILAAAFSACSEDISLNPAMSLFSDSPEVLDETAIFRMVAANMAEGTELRIPVTFGGTAERGVDYETSGDEFIFGGESPVDAIVVTTLKFGTGKTVSMSVELPEGVAGGKHLKSEFTLQEIPAFITFSQSHKLLADSTLVVFGLKDKDGGDKTLGIEAEISVSVDKTKSTAVEGEDFEFADSSHFTIAPGKQQGELKIKNLKIKPEAGKDKIVFTLTHHEKFGEGAVRELEVSLLDTLWSHLDGKWKIETILTDTDYMMAFWGENCTGYDMFPTLNEGDAVTFDLENSLFTPSFVSDFKLYFTGKSGFRKGPELTLDLGEGESADLQTFILDNTNRYFSSDYVSEDKESLVGARIIEGVEDEEPERLDFYIIDYMSKSFMPELEAGNKYAPEKPVAATPGQYINITFVK